jgi:hypothetical protein
MVQYSPCAAGTTHETTTMRINLGIISNPPTHRFVVATTVVGPIVRWGASSLGGWCLGPWRRASCNTGRWGGGGRGWGRWRWALFAGRWWGWWAPLVSRWRRVVIILRCQRTGTSVPAHWHCFAYCMLITTLGFPAYFAPGGIHVWHMPALVEIFSDDVCLQFGVRRLTYSELEPSLL